MRKSPVGYYGLRKVLPKDVGIVGGSVVVEEIAAADGAAVANEAVVDEEREGDVE